MLSTDSANGDNVRQVDLAVLRAAVAAAAIAQNPVGTVHLAQLIRDGKTLREAIELTIAAGFAFVAQVLPHAA